jgi:tetratricopeptide (TPR) repeat protein
MLAHRDFLSRAGGVLLLLGTPLSPAAENKFTLNGRVRPPTEGITVGLHAIHTTAPFRVQKSADWKGRFKFSKLRPGTYTVIAAHPRWGEVRQTVEVGSSFADPRGRVEVTLSRRTNESADDSPSSTGVVIPVQELTIADKARAHFRKADQKLREGKIEKAIEHLHSAVEISPQFGDAWNQLGIIAHRHSKFEQAEAYFRRATGISPNAFGATVNLGAALLALGRTEEALVYTQRAHGMRPDDSLANAQLGSIFFRIGNNEDALRYLKRSKEIDPAHYGYPQLELARIYIERGKHQKAIEELEDFEARHPESPLVEANRKALKQLKAAMSVSGGAHR